MSMRLSRMVRRAAVAASLLCCAAWGPAAQARAEGSPDTAALVELVAIPGGANTMGSYDRYENERPAHTVVISPFLMARTELTQLQYQTVLGRNPSAFRQGSLAMLHPVENVCWYDAVLFCNLLSQKEGLAPCYYADETFATVWAGQSREVYWNRAAGGYRLPTEAEWEYAARGGNRKDILYAGGDTPDEVAWYEANSGAADEAGLDPEYMAAQGNWSHRVGLKKPNGFGLHDMSGNVREWCWDWLGPFVNRTATDPAGPGYGSARILRGGGFASGGQDITVSVRSQALPGVRSPIFGIRVCRNAPADPSARK